MRGLENMFSSTQKEWKRKREFNNRWKEPFLIVIQVVMGNAVVGD